ncbi:MAG: hypothetical protein JSV21_05040 [Nitrospirota bacterium]|nr:MAG: hypothetical protein JSV21_05040 [Nitrospirota bacterium]
MSVGFIEHTGGRFYLSLFEEQKGGHFFNERRELKAGDAYLAKILEEVRSFTLDIAYEDLNSRIITLPFSDTEKIRDIIPFQLEGMTMEKVDDIIYDFAVLDKTGSGYNVAVAYISRAVLRAILGELAALGIRPEVITSIDFHKLLNDETVEVAAKSSIDEMERTQLMAEILSSGRINLARKEFSFSGEKERAKGYYRYSAILLVVIYLLLSAYLMLDTRSLSTKKAQVDRNAEKLFRSMLPDEKRIVDPLLQLRSKKKQIETKFKELNDVRPLDVLREISMAHEATGIVNHITIESDLITLKGEAGSAEDVKKFADSLKDKFRRKVNIETGAASGGNVAFTIQIVSGGPA